MSESMIFVRSETPAGCDMGHGFSSRACERGTNGCVVEHDATKLPQSRAQLEALLRRSLAQLDQWQRKYGEHNPEWLPPAGDVRLAEDIDVALAAPAALETAKAPESPSDDELRALWKAAGGRFHGPNIETGTMPESKLLPFLRGLLKEEADPMLALKAVALSRDVLAMQDEFYGQLSDEFTVHAEKPMALWHKTGAAAREIQQDYSAT